MNFRSPTREFGKGALMDCCGYLQPVTPSLDQYQAHWWNEGFGKLVLDTQKQYIDDYKKSIINCGSLEEIPRFVNSFKSMKWPPNNIDPFFWGSDFGISILSNWANMWTKHFESLRTLS